MRLTTSRAHAGARALPAVAIGLAVAILTACGGGATPVGVSRQLKVVAGENFWGSIATQLLGSHGRVQSVITDANTNPHAYSSGSADARAFAEADIVILNGAGYDDWGRRLLETNPSTSRKVLLVSGVVGARTGANPHFWYNPAMVGRVADALTRLYIVQDPPDSNDFSSLRRAFDQATQPYLAKVTEIKQKYGGAPVGSTESVFLYMAQALGLSLVTAPGFMQAVAEGSDPPAGLVAEFQDQISQKKIKLLVYNSQTPLPATTGIKAQAASVGVPVVIITETIPPGPRTFQDWQLGQLRQVEDSLAKQAA